MSVEVVKFGDSTKCTWTFGDVQPSHFSMFYNSDRFVAPVGSNAEWTLSFNKQSSYYRTSNLGRSAQYYTVPCKGYIGLTLVSSKSNLPVTASVSLRFVTKYNEEIRIVKEQKAKFLTDEKKLYCIEKDLAFGNTMIVICELRFDRMELVKHVNFLGSQEYNDSEPFIKNEHFSDVTIELPNQVLKAHKVILAANSAYFAKILEDDPERKIISLKHLAEEPALEIFRFIYTEKVSNLEKYALKLLIDADHYKLNKHLLKEMCEVQLSIDLTAENAVERLIFADNHSANYLKSMAIEFINSNRNAVTENSWDVIPSHLIQEIYDNLMDKQNPSS